jgi:ATP-dependent helicase/nuclease subunit A
MDDEDSEEGAGFPVRLKKSVEKKRAGKTDTAGISGDSIINDDTFFGLLLPALASHAGGPGEKAPFFNLETIPVYSEEYLRQSENTGLPFPNNPAGLRRFFETAEPFYQNAKVLTKPLVSNKRRAPTSFSKDEFAALFPALIEGAVSAESAAPDSAAPNAIALNTIAPNGEFISLPGLSGEDAHDIFAGLDPVLKSFAQKDDGKRELFSAADFGSVAHACVEALLKETEPDIPPKLAGRLNPAEAKAILEAGQELALRFLRSPLGAKAAAAELRKSEFPFRTLVKTSAANTESTDDHTGLFISGTIDLLFEDSTTVYVLDFKTDARENPAEHLPQMAFYRQAAAALFSLPHGKECRVCLYYLRTGRVFEVYPRRFGE